MTEITFEVIYMSYDRVLELCTYFLENLTTLKATDHNFYQDTRDSKPTKSIFYDPFDSLNTQNIDVKTKKRHLFHFDSN